MIPRYEDKRITATFSDEEKVKRWDSVEIAVLEAKANLGLIPRKAFDVITHALKSNPCDIAWWLAREKETNHDLAAYLDERRRYIPVQFQPYWHQYMTSYDTEDAAFCLALHQAACLVDQELSPLRVLLRTLATEHRFTIMLDRTHGQWAKLRSFGSRCLTWLELVRDANNKLHVVTENARRSRISGAIGNYGGGLTHTIEKEALNLLNLWPFLGATQILPRQVYAPLAQTLRLVAEALGQIAVDFRLGARSGLPLYHEPFAPKQKGSSAMPHKKNTINTEQMGGMLNLVRGAEQSILLSIQTWEARAIEQSCVERVAWPDLFHEVLRMISVMTKVFKGIVVYPDNMLQEIHNSCGTYASDEAKNFLAEQCARLGQSAEVAYRIVQLASFNVFEPRLSCKRLREELPSSLEEADALLLRPEPIPASNLSIRTFIPRASLFPVEQLDAGDGEVVRWNTLLKQIFEDSEVLAAWDTLFLPSHLLKEESYLFEQLTQP